ncbi:hypothetical protein PWY87_09100 [Kribbella solani]|uniref:hypothetical protein n=1 Tax=Kribbella solani TaxID=236067 RepID=UPI0029A39F3F|nr:hypothetical protein [Kribbella solani]MDX2969484.1 hypothetical protein [Kribbella solani]MDX3001822.1 hypothetical protein [Kribbella solani]
MPQDVLAGVRRILDERRAPEETIRAIRRLLQPPAAPRPRQHTDAGWPVLRASSWEQHTSPKVP